MAVYPERRSAEVRSPSTCWSGIGGVNPVDAGDNITAEVAARLVARLH